MQKWKWMITLLVMVLGLAACEAGSKTTVQETSQAETAKEQTVIVGFDDTFAPMGFKNEKGEIVGFDVDLAQAISEKTGLKFVFQPIDWTLKEQELSAGNIDAIWNGYTISEERKAKVLFSDAYMKNAQIIIVKQASDIQQKADLAGKVVATQTASSAYEAIETSGLAKTFKNQEIISYASYNEVFGDLEAGRCDAIVVDETLGRYYMNQSGQNNLRVLEENFGEEEYAIGFRQDASDLKATIDQALKELKSDKTYEKIYQKWFN